MNAKQGIKTGSHDFFNGLVFGFDVGTGSIGYAVRKGDTFKDVGVLICQSEGSDLSKRRDLRRQRRTLRSRKHRRQWFAKELIKLGLSKPEKPLDDPISLRLRALKGEPLTPGELYTALTHLFKRRGYSKVPWANAEKTANETAKPKKADEEGKIKEAVKEIVGKLGGRHPCQFLAEEKIKVGKSPTTNWARRIYWPREALRDEFLEIAKAQWNNFPKLAEKANWLLYGNTREIEGHHVYFKSAGARDPGVLGLRWPRFDNRGPALDSLQPVDAQGRPLHVVRRSKEVFINAQWELALMNFRVLDANTRQKIDPRIHFPIFIEKGRCPFCLQTIARTDLGHAADIEHLVPRALVDCNEFYNLTVSHIKCNRELKGERTPFAAFGGTTQWPDIKVNAEKTFSGRKLEIFLSPTPS